MLTKENIASEAIKLFNEHGLNKVGVRDIAKHLNISPGNLSYHFSKKEDLIVYIAEELMRLNSEAFDEYRILESPDLFDFLKLIKQIHLNFYKFRGVVQDFVEVSRIFERENYRYHVVEKQRELIYLDFLSKLHDVGELNLSGEDIEFLISYIKFFTRFWVVEAFVNFKGKSKSETVNYYLKLLSKQLSLFGTTKGKKSIKKFVSTEL